MDGAEVTRRRVLWGALTSVGGIQLHAGTPALFEILGGGFHVSCRIMENRASHGGT
jgi:hypothetical protein